MAVSKVLAQHYESFRSIPCIHTKSQLWSSQCREGVVRRILVASCSAQPSLLSKPQIPVKSHVSKNKEDSENDI